MVTRVLSVVAILALPWASFPQTDTAPPASEGRLGPPPLREVSGEIKEVDRGRNQLTVLGRDLKVTLEVDRETTIFIEGHTGTLADLKPGQFLRAAYEEVAGKYLAQWIELSPGRPKKSTEGRSSD